MGAAGPGTVVHVYYPPGYGLHLFGLIIPFPPAPVLWTVAALDLAATIWLWRRRSLWGAWVAMAVVSAYLAVVGMFSIGPIFMVLFVVQVTRLVTLGIKGLRGAGRKAAGHPQ